MIELESTIMLNNLELSLYFGGDQDKWKAETALEYGVPEGANRRSRTNYNEYGKPISLTTTWTWPNDPKL